MNRTICDRHFFRSLGDRLGVGYRLCSFSWDIDHWNGAASAEERDLLLHFLDGGVVVAGEVWEYWVLDDAVDSISMELTQKARTTEGFLSFIFNDYREFTSRCGFGLLTTQAQVLKESVQVLRIFRGCRKGLGKYTKYTVSYRVRFHLKEPIRDLTDQELNEPFKYDFKDSRMNGWHSWARAIKAVAQRPGRLFCSELHRFIVLQPQGLSEAERIFREEFEKKTSFDLSDVVLYGPDFAFSQEDRKDIEESKSRVSFFLFGGKLVAWDVLGRPYSVRRNPSVKVRVPLLERNPHLFVKNCRKGLDVMGACVNRWKEQGTIGKVAYKFGCFEFVSYGSRSVSDTLEFVSMIMKFLKAATNFVDFLMGDGADSRSLKEKMADLVLEKVQLDPMAYCEHSDPMVSRLALFCVNGGY